MHKVTSGAKDFMRIPAKVLPANHEFVKRVLKDFRIEEAGKRFVAKLDGEGKFFDAWAKQSESRKVFVEFLTEAEWLQKRVSFARRWLQALRLHFLSFTLLPQLLILGWLFSEAIDLNPWLVLGAFLSTTLLHLACNLWNDYEDHLRGVDSSASSGGSGTIQKLWIPASHIRNAAICFFIAAVGAGFYVVGTLDWYTNGKVMLALGCIGTAGAASYSGWPFHYKYLALGEVFVFLLCGPLLSIGALTLLAPEILSLSSVALAAIPLGLQAVLRLHGGNIRRIPYDIQAGARTIANLLGFKRSIKLYILMLAALYLWVPVVFFLLPSPRPLLFLSYLSLPVAIYQIALIRAMRGPLDPSAMKLRNSSTYLDLSFGLFYTFAFFF